MKPALISMLFVLLLTACSSGSEPIEQTQTAVAIQQQQLQLTRTALSLGPTQTALAREQATLEAQIAATQTALSREQVTLTTQIAATHTHAANPNPVITRNEDWSPVIQEFDGVMMVLVPAGCFMMGSNNGLPNEQPVHEQCFDEPFWIDQTEVTQADFERLGGVKANANAFDGDQCPVERITWFEARDFCAVRGARLPSEAEWEYAARGPAGWDYLWGDSLNANNVVWNGSGPHTTENVATIAAGRSWVGAFDLSGNVWEWVSSLYLPYDSQENREADPENSTYVLRVLRGGSRIYTMDSPSNLRASHRYGDDPGGRDRSWGFRCARSS